MIKWLLDKFVISKAGDDDRKKRLLCGRLSGAIGILLNTLLGLMKVFVGLFTGSVAILADAANNLSDSAASVITLVGFSLASKKSDAEHPFGHARYEYMTGVIVSALVIVVGVMLIITSYKKIVDPIELVYSPVMVIVLVVLLLAKLWLFRFNINLSKMIESASLKATGLDSRNDAIVTASTLAVLFLFRYAGINIDGFVGIAVGCFVIYSGLNMVKETAGPLLGQSPDPRLVKEIGEFVLRHEGVLGIHDLIVHDYGPGHVFVSVHIEVDSREDVFKSHELIDDIEEEANSELKIFLVGHMDPLDTQCEIVAELKEALGKSLSDIEGVVGIHDIRFVDGPVHAKVIFDVVTMHENREAVYDKVKKTAQKTLTEINPKYIAVINQDLDFFNQGEKV